MTISQHNANQTITELSFRSGTDRLTLAVVRSSYSIDDLLDMALQRHVVTQYPFVYEYPAVTALNQLTFYEHDHLGNLRVAFTPVVDCNSPTGLEPDPLLNHPNSSFTLEQVVDYYPYGKILRQYVNSNGPEKYLSTQHERDQETGLDYRGARYYDSDVARFLSLDPLAADYAAWSPYNYVMGNPISLIDPTGRSVDNYVFNEDGRFVRHEVNDHPDKLVIENSKSGDRTDYDFNDPQKDVADLKSLMNHYGEDFKNVKMVYGLSSARINGMMSESGVEPMSYLGRRWFAATESGSGKMDFSSYHLSTELDNAGEANRWDGKSILYENGPSPFFTVQGHHTAYNLMDMGNWLWGNAVNRIGGSSNHARSWSLWNDAHDTQADQRAIQNGWFFQEGYQPIRDCPQNR